VSDERTMRALLALTSSGRPAHDAALPEQVRWLEELTRVAASALDDAPAQAAITDLRAALGAVVQWGRGPRTPESLVELELVFRALVARGSVGLYEAIARELRALADVSAQQNAEREACRSAADAYTDAARALAEGRAVSAAHLQAMRALHARLNA
jgi:hypothetical protein